MWLKSSPQLEMKQKSLMSLGNEAEEKPRAEAAEANPESLGECADSSRQCWAFSISVTCLLDQFSWHRVDLGHVTQALDVVSKDVETFFLLSNYFS